MPVFDDVPSNNSCTEIISETPCENVTYYPSIDAEASVSFEVENPSFNALPNGANTCQPEYIDWLVPARVTPAEGAPFDITISGVWTLIQLEGLNVGRYRFPSGYWPANDGSGRSVSVSSGSGYCFFSYSPNGSFRFSVDFFRMYGVHIKYPVTPTSGSGGTTPGGGSNCDTEWIRIEINYDDGTGWHTWWEGYATVCE
jgi:hypothetical protein